MTTLDWSGASVPARIPLQGNYVRLEPLDPDRHAAGLFTVVGQPEHADLFRYLPDEPPATLGDLLKWASRAAAADDPLFYAVVDDASGRVIGRQALMRMDPANGVIEVGHILWSPALARTRGATEAIFLFCEFVFGLGYRRLEWKCNDLNSPSKRAAERFGFRFEGVFRQHMVVKGRNRDTAWFSMLDSEWPRMRAGYDRWLNDANFDDSGQQLTKLRFTDV